MFLDYVVKYLSERKLPVLEVFPDKFLFSSNAAARYLLCETVKEDNESAVDQWLDWESACLYVSNVQYNTFLLFSMMPDYSFMTGNMY